MKVNEALEHFGGSRKKLADALGITYQAVYQWQEGKIPEAQRLRLQYEILPALRGRKALERANS